MTADPFTEAAHRDRDPSVAGENNRAWFVAGAEWQAAQEPTTAEVDAGMAAAAQSMPAAWWGGTEWRRYVEEILSAASATRRDEEKR